MSKLGEATRTGRGFGIVEFEDRNGHKCNVQCSSAIGDDEDSFDRPGSSFLWIGVSDADPKILAMDARALGLNPKEQFGWIPYHIPKEVLLSTRMHLGRKQVAELIETLQGWLDTGKLG